MIEINDIEKVLFQIFTKKKYNNQKWILEKKLKENKKKIKKSCLSFFDFEYIIKNVKDEGFSFFIVTIREYNIIKNENYCNVEVDCNNNYDVIKFQGYNSNYPYNLYFPEIRFGNELVIGNFFEWLISNFKPSTDFVNKK